MRCRRNSNGQGARRSRDRGQLEERFDQSKGGECTCGGGARRAEAQHRRDRRIAALKNALDIGSRPYGKSAWNGKPGAVVSASPGAIGAFGANHHLRQSLVFLNVTAMPQPEAYIGGADKLFDASGRLVNDGTRKFLQGFMQAYAAWIAANTES